jgi:hypothetical protein
MYSPTASNSVRPYKGIAYPGEHAAIVDQRTGGQDARRDGRAGAPPRCSNLRSDPWPPEGPHSPTERPGNVAEPHPTPRPNRKLQPGGTLVKAVERAWRWQRMLDDGVYASVSEIGEAANISKSYVSRILRLALLAPDIIEAILAGKADQSLMLERLERPLPASRCEQRRLRTVAVGIPFSARPCPVGGRPKMLRWLAVWQPQRDRLASGSRDALDRDHPLARL